MTSSTPAPRTPRPLRTFGLPALQRSSVLLTLVTTFACNSGDGNTPDEMTTGSTSDSTGTTAATTSTSPSSTSTSTVAPTGSTTSSVASTGPSGGTGTSTSTSTATSGATGATSTAATSTAATGSDTGPATSSADPASSDSSGTEGACAFTCVADCAAISGTPQTGACDGGQQCCESATEAPNPLSHLVDSAKEVGLLLANRFKNQQLAYSSVANLPGDGYKNACEWYGALGVANLTQTTDLLNALVTKFDPFKGDFVSAMTAKGTENQHVDRYIYGMVPLEIYLQTDDASYLPLGTDVADDQQVTNQTRDAIDDMFMMTGLQLEAYRATGEAKYIDFMSDTMVDYLGAQQDNGLFFHNVTEARVHWGRGNGWFAAGMAEMMRDLPKEHANYATIEAGYKKMMTGLLTYQGDNGLWSQVLDQPDNASNWSESSGSAMFTYAMIAGVRHGILDEATYVPVIDAAWQGLQGKINDQGDVADICTGTWYHASAAEYMALTRLTGDGHGQAPVLWAAAELLR